MTNERELVENAKRDFLKIFGSDPTFGAIAPGRVNLIGEHVDYCDGFVLPMAIPLYTFVMGSKNANTNATACRLWSSSLPSDAPVEIPLRPSVSDTTAPSWTKYIQQVMAQFEGDIPSFDLVVSSSVPLGGGLSSSAALEVATHRFLEAITGKNCSAKNVALACQRAEHACGMPCGIMDQMVVACAQHGHAVLLDCRSLATTLVPLNDPEIVILVTNSNVKHELTGSEYPERRASCEAAARLIGLKSLRDASTELLNANRHTLDQVTFKRAWHVVTEIQRTTQAAECLQTGEYEMLGKLMVESHNSLRDNFEVSCAELDQLVELAMACRGVYGSRMTGGGFGGCTVTLCDKKEVEAIKQRIQANYKQKVAFYVCDAVEGAQILDI